MGLKTKNESLGIIEIPNNPNLRSKSKNSSNLRDLRIKIKGYLRQRNATRGSMGVLGEMEKNRFWMFHQLEVMISHRTKANFSEFKAIFLFSEFYRGLFVRPKFVWVCCCC
jgi:hypothetical protein